WWTAGTIRSSMRARGARDERHLSVVRDGVSRGPRQGAAGRSARALRGVQQRVSGQRCRRRAGRFSLRRSPAGTRGVGSPARRLARALVSDLVVYHPEKRQQGLRDGTLPQLFKDEIEKSWQEYVEQVGAEIAKSTSFWGEALNEILAGGNKVF